MNIDIKLLINGKLPQRQTSGSAGYDLFAAESAMIKPQEVKLIKLGFIIALPQGWEAQIRSRSGLAFKKQLFVLNSPGTIDWDYRDEVGCILMNLSNEPVHINLHDRIAQMVFARVALPEFTCVEAFEDKNFENENYENEHFEGQKFKEQKLQDENSDKHLDKHSDKPNQNSTRKGGWGSTGI